MALDKQSVIDLYRKRAKNYDFSANLYYLIGFHFNRYRRLAVESLGLSPGDTVVEIACGAGLNFPLLLEQVGPAGKVIGVDITDRMLEQARRRVEAHGWENVELVHSDASTFPYPKSVKGILSTFAITLIPEFDTIILKGREALLPGGRFCVLDFKKAEDKPLWTAKLLVRFTKPFGVSLDLAERHPWESLERYFPQTTFHEFYFGYTYIAVGRK